MIHQHSQQKLFSPIQLGALPLKHRVVMAPMTRFRTVQPGDLPSDLMVEYYDQRASDGGLLISEGATVSVTGRGYLGSPGIYSEEQVAAWRKVTDAVHKKGGYIFVQLWHVGRSGHVDLTNGAPPVGPSAVPWEGTAHTANGWVPTSPNRALETGEIAGIVEEFRQGAARARAAGFDGAELHSANGYILDEFLQDGSNRRSDAYGGSCENRARLLFETIEAVASVWSADRIGVRLSPSSVYNSMSDSNPEGLFRYVANKLNPFGLAYLHIIEPRVKGNETHQEGPAVAAALLRRSYEGSMMAAGGFDPDTAEAIVERGDADLVAFGRSFIANPDLPKRIKLGLPLNPYDRSTFYGRDRRGYTDYPFYDRQAAS